jgi:hypothetical protein
MREIYLALGASDKSVIFFGEKAEAWKQAREFLAAAKKTTRCYQTKPFTDLNLADQFLKKQRDKDFYDRDVIIINVNTNSEETIENHTKSQENIEENIEEFREICKLRESRRIAWIQKNPISIDYKDRDGNTLAHEAAAKGNLKFLKYLFENYQSILAVKNRFGETILHKAAKKFKPNVMNWIFANSEAMHVDICARCTMYSPQEVNSTSALEQLHRNIDKLPEMKRQQAIEYTFLFPEAQHWFLRLSLGEQNGHRVITKLEIDRTMETRPLHVTWKAVPNFSKYIDKKTGKVKAMYEIRHIRSISSLVSHCKQRWERQKLSSLIGKKLWYGEVKTMQDALDYVYKKIYDKINSKKNLFIGLALENRALGWLSGQLTRFKEKDVHLSISIPHEYLGYFLCHQLFKKLSEDIFDKKNKRFLVTATNFSQLYELAHNDYPKLAFKHTLISSHALYWLQRECAVIRLNLKAYLKVPFELKVPPEYQDFFVKRLQSRHLTEDCYDQNRHVILVSPKTFGKLRFQLQEKYSEYIAKIKTETEARKAVTPSVHVANKPIKVSSAHSQSGHLICANQSRKRKVDSSKDAPERKLSRQP